MNTSSANVTIRKPPTFFIASILAAAAIVPMLFLIDLLDGGGDGLQTFWPSVFVFFGCVIVSLVCMIVGFVRRERARWLAIFPVLLWAFPVGFFAF